MRAVGFDLETLDADKLYSSERGSFVRLGGVILADGSKVVTTSLPLLLGELDRADLIFGHNIFRFDLPALAVHAGADYARLAAKAVDTLILARLADPPGARGQKPWSTRGYFGLDAVAQRLGVPGKTDSFAALAKEFGGAGNIPTDEPRFLEYLAGDLDASAAVLAGLTPYWSAYAQREMKVAAVQSIMSVTGWRLDEALLAKRVDNEELRKANALAVLNREFGIPTKGKSPLASKEGKEALRLALNKAGAIVLPITATGELATSADAMSDRFYFIGAGRNRIRIDGVLARYGDIPEVVRIARLVNIVTGVSAKYGEVAKYLVDGRVHGRIGEDQASGRWAMTRPSLTNIGKRGGKVRARQVFIPDEGEVLLSADLDQVDMRALAGLSQDRAYMALFAPGMDVHAEIAQLVLGDRTRREEAKPIGHGWNYGRSVGAIAEATGIDIGTVQRFDLMMRSNFPKLCRWREEVRERAAAGDLLDNGFGRWMRCDPRRAHTQAPALMGQGGARDLMCEGLLRLDPSIHPMLRAVVHDEIVLSVPAKWATEIAAHVKEALTFTWRDVPITAGVSKPGPHWAACYDKEGQ